MNDPMNASIRIDRIIETLPGMNQPHMVQKSLSSSHELNIYKNLPNKRGFQFFMALPPPVGSTFSFDGDNDVDGKGVRLDVRRELMKTTLYASVDPSLTSAEQIEEWKRTKEGLYRHDNNEFPWQIFTARKTSVSSGTDAARSAPDVVAAGPREPGDGDWDLNFKTIAERLNGNGGYFNRLEAKSLGVVGVLERKKVASLEQVFIGKETHPLADVDTDEPTDETMDDGVFSASRFVINGRKLNWSAIEPHRDAISKVLSERAGQKGCNLNRDNLRKLYGVFNVDEDGVTSIKVARKRRVVQTDAWWKVLVSLRNCGKYDQVAEFYGCEVEEVNRFDALDHRHEYGEEPTLDPKLLAAAIKQANRYQKEDGGKGKGGRRLPDTQTRRRCGFGATEGGHEAD
jgi:hypothetical protein